MNIQQLGFIPAILLMTLFLLSCRDLRWLRGSVEKKLIGEWKGTNDGETGSIILNKDSSWVFIIGDFVLPATEEGIIVENMIWTVDDIQDPIHLDCIVYLKQTESGMKRRVILPLILRFLGQNKIQIRSIFELSDDNTTSPPTLYMGKRPTGFETESDDQITLIRQ